MKKEELKKNQPVAWKILSQALKQDKLSHAYLFYGPAGSPKRQMALLLAQSVFCEHPDEDGFACQMCSSCQALEREQSPDFFWVHPGGIRQKSRLTKAEREALWQDKELKEEKKENWRMKKEHILHLQSTFAQSSMSSGNQVYILEQYDTATPEASNSLLKFLEEPHEGLIGILTTDELPNILPTIQSRCQLIAFRPATLPALKEELRDLFEDEDTLEMLALAGWQKEEALLFDEHFERIKEEALAYYPNKHRHDAIVEVQTHLFYSKEVATRTNIKLFLQWILYLAKKDQEISPLKALQIRHALLESLDRLKRPVDGMLLLDAALYKVRKICQKQI